MQKVTTHFIIAFLLLALTSCNRDKVIFEQVAELPNAGWTYADTIDFQFTVTDTAALYRLLLYFEFNKEYPYENLYGRITTRFPNDSTRRDVISFELADNAGRWHGNCDLNSCKLNIPLQDPVKFPLPGEYAISFEQYMRQERLEGITHLGLKLILPGD